MKISLKSNQNDGSSKVSKPGKFSLSMNKNKPGSKFGSSSKVSKISTTTNVFNGGKRNQDDEENKPKVSSIDSYDEEALKREKALEEQGKVLVIKPPTSVFQKIQEAKKVAQDDDSENNEAISYGLNTVSNGPTKTEPTPRSQGTKITHENKESSKPVSITVGDNPTAESYKKVPVEEFGAAFLRGLGWKGEVTNKRENVTEKITKAVQRQEFLGIGAKPIPGPSAEAKNGKRKSEMKYSPVLIRDKETGKIIDEEELRKQAK
ncbi:hypothetical protein DASC09_032940 [Saccharomycopsis crataegensis]|uniref:Pre-mRNA-splicing factor n=1 Tax=Saccharomycopsis crataegensis TaxID=43959 RepID=A0AAV5QNE5_9ASCO|nr:hypothetical protein DASC09_032940 [Saccharomycopsis crataegensis]